MCYTWRHDYGLLKEADPGGYSFPGTAGMTREEQQYLWQQMAQIYDNDISHLLKEANEILRGDRIVLPKTQEQAEAMLAAAEFYLNLKK